MGSGSGGGLGQAQKVKSEKIKTKSWVILGLITMGKDARFISFLIFFAQLRGDYKQKQKQKQNFV